MIGTLMFLFAIDEPPWLKRGTELGGLASLCSTQDSVPCLSIQVAWNLLEGRCIFQLCESTNEY